MSASPLVVTVTGASGRIAYSLLPLLCHGDAFGNHRPLELRLLDIHHCQKKLEGVKLEIDDSAYPLVEKVVTTVDPAEAFQDTDVAILLGGFPRRPGMQRNDLIAQNASIMKEHGEAIERYSSRNVKVVVIANPANTNCFIASESAPSIPKYNFTCLTRLDHDRLVGMVVNKLNSLLSNDNGGMVTNPSHVRNVAIFGNHSTTQVPYVDAASVLVDNQWQSVRSLVDSDWIDEVLPGMIQNRGAEIIHHLEASSAMSAARAIIRHLHDWIGPPPPRRTGENGEDDSPIFSMGVFSPPGNPYNIPEGIVFSFPCRRVIGSYPHRHDALSHSHHRGEVHPHQDYEIVCGLPLTDAQNRAMAATIDELLMEKTMAHHNFAETVTAKLEQDLNI